MCKIKQRNKLQCSLDGFDKDMDSTNNITSYATQEINKLIQWQKIMLCQMKRYYRNEYKPAMTKLYILVPTCPIILHKNNTVSTKCFSSA